MEAVSYVHGLFWVLMLQTSRGWQFVGRRSSPRLTPTTFGVRPMVVRVRGGVGMDGRHVSQLHDLSWILSKA